MELFIKILGLIAIIGIIAILFALPTMYLWNWLMPVIFGVVKINFWQALGINILSGFLFKNMTNSKTNPMYNFFLTKVRYDKLHENWQQKSTTEEYLVDALSWTEAEARIIEEMKIWLSCEFSIYDIRRYKITESFFNETGDRYFKARLYFLYLDEKSGSEKKTGVNMLVQANDIEEAKQIIVAEMDKGMIDYTIQRIEETAIIDVFTYKAD